MKVELNSKCWTWGQDAGLGQAARGCGFCLVVSLETEYLEAGSVKCLILQFSVHTGRAKGSPPSVQ